MKTWRCWQTRRRIPRWRQGDCSPSEAAAIAAHVAACAACAAEVDLEAALRRAAGAAPPAVAVDRHEALWERLEAALPIEARSRASRKGSAWRLAPGAWQDVGTAAGRLVSLRDPAKLGARHQAPGARRCRPGWVPGLGLAAIAVVVGLALGGRLRGEHPEARPDPVPRLDLSLWEPEPIVENPMGPMTERLLVLLEEKR